MTIERRHFLKKLALIAGSALVASPAMYLTACGESREEEISPNEDLMREHGVLRRILLIYREGIHRLESHLDLDPALIKQSAQLIHQFIEEYHEKLEEDFLFPRFEKAGKLLDLVITLRIQHVAGRQVTNHVLDITSGPQFLSQGKNLVDLLNAFIRMYEPHAAREDTVLFPAFQQMVSPSEYKELGEQFEGEEHKRFGQHGFKDIIAQIANIEKTLGIYDLAKFTPQSKFNG